MEPNLKNMFRVVPPTSRVGQVISASSYPYSRLSRQPRETTMQSRQVAKENHMFSVWVR